MNSLTPRLPWDALQTRKNQHAKYIERSTKGMESWRVSPALRETRCPLHRWMDLHITLPIVTICEAWEKFEWSGWKQNYRVLVYTFSYRKHFPSFGTSFYDCMCSYMNASASLCMNGNRLCVKVFVMLGRSKAWGCFLGSLTLQLHFLYCFHLNYFIYIFF